MISFSAQLLKWYDANKRDLPWRHTRDPYLIWVSEMMLQQTTVNTVIAYYERWIKTYPTLRDLARAPLQQVLKSWQGLGYYNRARNLHKAAVIVLNEYGGKLPDDPLVVRDLPGFGPYSTASVLSIAYDRPMVLIDANVRRLVMRLLAIEAMADAKQDKAIGDFLSLVLPRQRAGDFNQALMEMGALVCRSKEPLCNTCPLKASCKAFVRGLQEIIPTPKKKVLKDVRAVIAVIEDKGRYLIQKRPAKGLLADLWEFPGGKIEAKELPQKALAREIKEELGVELDSAAHLFDVKHFYTQFRVHLAVYACRLKDRPLLNAGRKWVTEKQFSLYPMPSGSARIVERLLKKKR